ncbi:ribonucleotide-diphosphate reductase subunit beta [Marine Group I thaumarchaeote]|uniref:Ribonucleotide-diphosphate reductase subunit beta n=1 Tax=Marine Group I thaumarchaeote TaxID=2511932 RepID=A0A7K4NCR9_9ARCH|nr:ribonucleotide-diphosphate reductase subunit beta [Marine Group I thaumarchaeote]
MYSTILTELGIAVFDDKKCLKIFPFENPAEEYVLVKKHESKLSELGKFLANGENVIVNDHGLLDILKKKSIDVQLMDAEQIDNIQSTKTKLLVNSGFANDENDAMEKLREFAIQLSSSKVTEVSQSPDLHIIQAINTLDETDKIINSISSRLREWYGLHFPELDNLIDSINGYSQIVLSGTRENISKEDFEKAGFSKDKVEMLSLIKEKSRGGNISEKNFAIVQSLAKQILNLFELRKNIEEHVDEQMKEEAPNISAILGTAVGARILAHAGSLNRLGRMPASTIQILGAEKALFRSLKTGANPPKHGILFQHAAVHAAPRWQRGKIARAVAAKAAIAARVDLFKAGLNETLLDKLNVRVKEIGDKYKKPVIKELKPEPKVKRKKSGRFMKRRRKSFGR